MCRAATDGLKLQADRNAVAQRQNGGKELRLREDAPIECLDPHR